MSKILIGRCLKFAIDFKEIVLEFFLGIFGVVSLGVER